MVHLLERRPLIIAHRGSPCSHPEETIEGFLEAARHGAAYLEFDLVGTRDGELILRHDLTLDSSTNIRGMAGMPPPVTRRVDVGVAGVVEEVHGHFAGDASLAQVKALTAVQPFPDRDHALDGAGHAVVTLREALALHTRLLRRGATHGLYIELKRPHYHATALGMDMPEAFLDAVAASGLTAAEVAATVVVQCFERAALAAVSRGAARRGLDIGLALLVACEQGLPPTSAVDELKALARHVAVAPDKRLLLELSGADECGLPPGPICPPGGGPAPAGSRCAGRLPSGSGGRKGGAAHAWMAEMRRLGVPVHVWTLRNEDRFMALDFRGDPHAELSAFLSERDGLGVDGAFVDCPITAAAWLASAAPLHQPPVPPRPSASGALSPPQLPFLPRMPLMSHALAALVGAVVACLILWLPHHKRLKRV